MKRGILVVAVCLVALASSAVHGQHDAGDAAHHAAPDAGAAAAGPPTAVAIDTAGCWDDYVARAIEIYLNLIDCTLKNEWYDWIGYLICELSYEFGAVMALAKFLACLNS